MNIFVLVIIYFTMTVVAESSNFINHGENVEESLSNQKNQPYVGLPVGTWKITDLSKLEKEEICIRQKSFCSGKCGGESYVNKNYCNQTTMGWMCSCQNQVPDVPPYHWPITLAECHGREKSCINGCTYGATKTICIAACNKYYKCDKAGSPSSGLRLENEKDKPNYNNSLENNSNSILLVYNIMKFTCIIFHAYIMNFLI